MNNLETYLSEIREKNPELADSIHKTVQDIGPQYIDNFSFCEHVVSLLVGDIQSGKTSQMFGIMCAAADAGFPIFILLTTDNILLQQQTYNRALKDLKGFSVFDENDYLRFTKRDMKKPAVIVLKKNGRVLKQWKNNLSSSDLLGYPLFVVDDEADAASLNTKVNLKKQSTINKNLEEIKNIFSCSIYLQVTGTPQSILLQTAKSGWRPYFIYYFKPGKNYLGGDFFFGPNRPKQVVLTKDDEAADLLTEDEFPENGLKEALIMHLMISAEMLCCGDKVCNFLIHPSVKTEEHEIFASKIGNYLNEIAHSSQEEETYNTFKAAYSSLLETKPDLLPFDQLYEFAIKQIQEDKIQELILNSREEFVDSEKYQEGINILVGGNSLGRGVTFPKLQTIYYCRLSKNPQADTMWQHARMFGYDRDSSLMRVFMPPILYKLFCDINTTNNSIIHQIESPKNDSDIKIIYPKGLNPTRKNVVDKKHISIYAGGVNYFPFYPINHTIESIDKFLSRFKDGQYTISLQIILKILEMVDSEKDDWSSKMFQGFINSLLANDPLAQGVLICRRNRDIAKGTGTMLSPNDRKLGDDFNDVVVLTMYKVTGNKGWDGQQIWIPNIKLPGNCTYYGGE
ncbi:MULTISPECIES: Z1 domain-containing protein [Acidaminococcus]|jgi:hypothetical protein|uniref:Z1 domain-containing protein n=1 Tax=Acidaminococcus TaxID=904 RepID=UPI0023F47A3A|nr:Z1 domain-containing protein [Acidaminococcus massiliensis]